MDEAIRRKMASSEDEGKERNNQTRRFQMVWVYNNFYESIRRKIKEEGRSIKVYRRNYVL